MRLLISLIYTTYQTLIYQFNANSYNRDGWQDLGGDTIFTSCGGIHYFGSAYGGLVVNSKLFNVPEDHSHIQVDCKILNIDGDTSVPVFEVDYRRRPNFESTFLSQNQLCGNSLQEYIQSTTLIIQHNRRTVWMFVETFNGGGLISLKLSTIKCQYNCDGCIENQKIFCLKWKLHQYSFIQISLTNFDGWTYVPQYSDHYYCGYCQYLLYQQIQYSTKLPLHKDVLIRFFKADGYTIIVDYIQGIKTISSYYQQVEILIENHYDTILTLKIQTQPISDYGQIRDFDVFYTQPEQIIVNYLNQGCLAQIEDKCLICQEGWIQYKYLETCHPICPVGTIQDKYCSLRVIQQQSEIIVSKQIEGCQEQIDNTCLICKEGWVKDKFLENCHPICGDGIIQGQEQCDDANLISNDSCYQCKYSCINFCKTCVFGICFECVFGFDLNSDFNCVSLCGDGNVVPYSAEQCDLTDSGEWDHCQDCRFVFIANCRRQLLSMCLVCEHGYQLLDNQCFPHCGDKFVLQQYEECDDGNLQPYDGCFECKFQCAEDCNICYLGQCILKCEDGYRFVNNRCLSVCGDQIVTKEEDCDDGNTIQFDGCFDCKYSYSCPENCRECYSGICLKCNDYYELLISNQCKFQLQLQLQCGDGFLQQQEECDDGNLEVLDGCRDCLIEQNWICTAMIRDSPSQCAFIQAPKIVMTYLNMTSNLQYIRVQFNQQVKIYSTQPLSETINFKLSNLNKKSWNSSLYVIEDVGSYVSFGEYVIEIEIHQLLEFRPILTIEVNQTVANMDNSVLDDFTKSITLQYPQYLEETQKEYAYKLKNLNMYLIYGLSEGWVKDKFLENCHPICGDGIIQGQEQCDDANLISNDSCYQCKYSCINFCKTCVFGICFECVFGFDLNSDFNCVSLCGDGNVVPYSAEQCDLTDSGEWDHCQDCRFVFIANCRRQLLSMCLVCEHGYQLLDNQCFPHCGDKFVLQQYEECDDGNLQPYDGCFECKFQCAEDCNICYLGQCILKCEDGYRFVNNRCLSVCGDQIVTKEEDCDDGNTIQFDGCFDCKYSYSCPENCRECYSGICLKCNDYYELLISNQCKFQLQLQLQCGDGFLQQQEECDDGNLEVLDGCRDCLIEQNWICTAMIRDSPSQCAFIQAPKIVMTYLNMTSNLQYIRVQFNQQVKIYSTQPLSETINFKLSNLNKKSWNSSLYVIEDVGSYVSFGEYVIEIEIHQLLEFRPILTIEVNQTVANMDNSVLDDFTKSITLQYPQYLEETQKEYAYKLKNLNMYLIYGLSGITCAHLILGSGNLFIEILAILQSQQYLRYINLQFPQNLEIYFSVNDLLTIQPLLDFLDFQYIFSLFELQQNQQPYSEGKFAVYQQNPSLIINLSFQILQCLTFLFLILLCNLIKKVMFKWIFCQRNFYYASTLSMYVNPKMVFNCQKSFYKICLKLLNLEKYMSFQGLQKALILNGWDMTFKILLYTRTFSTSNYLDIVQIIMTCVLLTLYFTILLDSFKCKQKLSKMKRFEILSYGRQFFFLFYLINFQNSQILQLGLLFMTNVLQISLLFSYRQIQNTKNYIVQMVVEISVLTFMLSSFLYIKECNEYFNEERKIILGWIHIIILSAGIIVETIFIIKDQYQAWKKLYKRKKPQCARHPLFI
ncbi:unnamed protein product [Paramecium octaurelia]|uniref:Uncharacterized protein n=1 Tax=Paramecium octaurelia TaxID=43137 RepID=A0A8S1TE65_PAROT|nr:unnamed protein product [Paramecium octaurelia]